ncbi:MAG: DUF58 domain-containing protein [Gemmatimonadetes bacterium]|nr:DUF58 domain-containing protein [Gemmatimonadota bacterium]
MNDAPPVVGADVLRQVKHIELRTRRLVGSLFSGEYRSVFRGQGMEFAEVREYQHGDDFRAIDWNVSARMGHPYVKLFEEEREVTLLLIVDRSGSVEFGGQVRKSDRAVEIAAVLALAAVRNNDRVGALVFSDDVDHVVPAAKGRLHALRVIRDLLAFKPVNRGTNLGGALTYSGKLLRHRSIVVVLSDFRAKAWEEQMRRLSRRHEVVAISIDDPREEELPDVGWIELEDAETRARLLVDTRALDTRTGLRVSAEEMRSARARSLERARVDHIVLQTDQPYAHTLMQGFAKRARRFAR